MAAGNNRPNPQRSAVRRHSLHRKGLMVELLMGYLTHLLQTIHQTFLALGMRRKFLSGLLVFHFDANYLKILILSPLLVEPTFGGIAEIRANSPHDCLNLAETFGAYVSQSASAHIKRPVQSHAPACRQPFVFVNDGINPARNHDVEVGNRLLNHAPMRCPVTPLGKRVNDKPPNNTQDADANGNKHADSRPIRWELLRLYHWLILGWMSFFTGAGMSAIWWLMRPNDAHHWRRGSDARYWTEAESRRPVNAPCSQSYLAFSTSSRAFLSDSSLWSFVKKRSLIGGSESMLSTGSSM